MPDLTTLALTALITTGNTVQPALSGQMIFIDPATGALTDQAAPSISNSTANAAPLRPRRDDAGLVAETLPDGSVMVDLQGRYQSVVQARIVNGEVEIEHVSAPQAGEESGDDHENR